jgi:tetratricopeptide (TPR) repeat protein
MIAAVAGCAVPHDDGAGIPLPSSGQLAAIGSEADTDYLAALKYWNRARDVVDGRISVISANLQEISSAHSQQGVAYYEKREGNKALKAFVEALRYDASNTVALDYLKNRYKARRIVPYTVSEGDTFEKIAENIYGAYSDTFAVIHFSGVADEKDLIAGEVIHLPLLDTFFSQPLLDYKRDILIARKLFKEEKYEELLPLVEKILKNHPGDQEASYLLNSSLVGFGNSLQDRQKYEEAVGALSRVDPAFRNVKDRILEIRELQKEQLAQDAEQLNTELFRKGELLYSQRKYPAALKVFREVDSGFGGVDDAIVNVREVMRMQADVHYKKGVKYFVEDNLTAAIQEWEKTLRYDPDHQKATDYISKSRRLLEKIKAVN